MTIMMIMMMMTIRMSFDENEDEEGRLGDHNGQDPLDADNHHAGEHCQNNDVCSMNDDHQLSKVVTS